MTVDLESTSETATPQHVPDILDVIAALSSDAVPTPPLLARALLDLLPDEVWENPDYRWLDPATKSGSILREVARRLMGGLANWEPDPQKRAEHILRNMIYGVGITQVHAEMTRRSLYVSRDATSSLSLVQFDTPDGNLPFVAADHAYPTNKDGAASGPCRICGAPVRLERGDTRENYAYAFIHGAYPSEEMKDMKFDVIVGNPPYQTGTEGTNRTLPVYQLFVDQAISLDPKYVAMIIPSRWFSGGLGLDDFRLRMIADRRMHTIVDNPKASDCFSGVTIKGGVNYFLWDRDWNGDCEFSTRVNGKVVSSSKRDLRRGQGVLIRDNRAAEIVERVMQKELASLESEVQPRLAFGDKFRTNFRGATTASQEATLPIIYNSGIGYISPDELERGQHLVEKWKVLLPMASSGEASLGEDGLLVDVVLGEPIAVAPGSVCTETYFIAGALGSRKATENLARYLTTKFVRFLVLQRKTTQHLTPDRFRFVPAMDFTRAWSDRDLYEHFELSPEEIEYIEATIRPREVNLSLDSPIPASHLPGGHKYRVVSADADAGLAESEDEE